ncbi:MAG: diacylglycerol kinase family protein, partial [Planctomycetia bacterium]
MENSVNQTNDPDPRESLAGQHVIVSVNPKAGRGCSRTRAERLVEILSEHGLVARIETDLEKIETEACQLAKTGSLHALVGVGGDGTATELANRITPEVPLVILAAGTENLLVRHVGWPRLPEPLAEVILTGRKQCIDLGRAKGRLFLMMLSCGVDAEVVRHLDERRSGHISHASYIGPIFRSVCH